MTINDYATPEAAAYNAAATDQERGSGFLSRIGGFLGGLPLGAIAQTGLSAAYLDDQLQRLQDIGQLGYESAQDVTDLALKTGKFKPFTVTTGFGDVDTTKKGGFETTLSADQQARQAALSGITGGLLTDFTGLAPDVSTFQSDALSGAEAALKAATGDTRATREANVYESIRAAQRPEEERQRLALQELLQSQGRTGLRTAQFGGSPEQFALDKARAEAQNTASLAAIQQAGAERQQDLAASQGLFGLTGQAAGLPALLEAAQLANVQSGLGLEYAPEQALLATLGPAINLSNIGTTARSNLANLEAETRLSGVEALLQSENKRAEFLRDLYGSIAGSAGQAAGQQGLFSSLFGDDTVSDLVGDLLGLFGG